MKTGSTAVTSGAVGPTIVFVVKGDDEQLGDLSFQDEVWLWLEVWSADRPELRETARRAADPAGDPWGYLAELSQLILDAD